MVAVSLEAAAAAAVAMSEVSNSAQTAYSLSPPLSNQKQNGNVNRPGIAGGHLF